MKFEIFPKNRMALFSLLAFALMVLGFALFFVINYLFKPWDCETFFSCPALTIPMLLAWFSSIVCVVMGIWSIFRDKQISLVLIILFLLALFVAVSGFSVALGF